MMADPSAFNSWARSRAQYGGESIANTSNPGGWDLNGLSYPPSLDELDDFVGSEGMLVDGASDSIHDPHQGEPNSRLHRHGPPPPHVQSMMHDYMDESTMHAMLPAEVYQATSSNTADYFLPHTPTRKRRYDQLDTPTSTDQMFDPHPSLEGRLPTLFEQTPLTLDTRVMRPGMHASGSIPTLLTPDSIEPYSSPLSAHGHGPFEHSLLRPTQSPMADRNHLQIPFRQDYDDAIESENGRQMLVNHWMATDAPRQWGDVNPENPPQSPGRTMTRRSATSAGSSIFCPHHKCTKEFSRKSDFDHHFRYHQPKIHKCPTCEKRFHFVKDVTRHVKTHDDKDRTFHCENPACEYHTKGFKRNDHLTRHVKNVHQGPRTAKRMRASSAPPG